MTASPQPALSFAALMLQRFVGRSTAYLARQKPGAKAGPKYLTIKEPLTEAVFAAHIAGEQPIGVFLLPEGGRHVRFAAIDLDDHEGELGWAEIARRAGLIRQQLRRFGEPLAVRSGGGQGIHLYVFFEKPAPAAGVRRVLGAVLGAAGFPEKSGLAEIFPKQEGAKDGFGSAIGLPFSRKGVPLDEDFNPLPMDEARAYLEATPFFPTTGMDEPEEEEKVLDLDRERAKRGRKSNPRLDWRKGVTGAPAGERDEYLYGQACRLRHDAVPLTDAEGIMIEAAAKCSPPVDAETALEKLHRVYERYPEGPGPNEKQSPPSQVDVLAELAQRAEVWRSPDAAFFVTITEGGHKEHDELGSKRFRRWLTRQYHQQVGGRVPDQQSVANALAAVESLMEHAAPVHEPVRRVGRHGDKLYIDLCDDQWRAVEIDAEGWRVVPQPPVRFIRSGYELPLPEPVAGGSVDELRPFINTSDACFRLLVAGLLAHLRPNGPFPIIAVHGEHGTAKSSSVRFARALTDPHKADLRAPPREDRDLITAARAGWVIAFDNISTVPQWMADGLCRIATGGAYSARAMRTDYDEVILSNLTRPIMLNGINDIDQYADLTSRMIRVTLDPIPEEKRKTEEEINAAFKIARPRITGALYTAVSVALRNMPVVKPDRLPRLADFAKWVMAAEEGLGWEPGTFMQTFDENQETSVLDALSGDTVARGVVGLVNFTEEKPDPKVPCWTGTTSDLLKELGEFVSDDVRSGKYWCHSVVSLARKLRKLAPGLRAAGINLELGKRDSQNRSLVLIYQNEPPKIEGQLRGGKLPNEEGAGGAF